MSDAMADWEARGKAQHEAEVAKGLHDAEGESRRRVGRVVVLMCHCSKRRREAAGFTTPPDEDLYFPPPSCPRCHERLDHDGDGWLCDRCCLSWDSNGCGSSCRFTDDYGNFAASGQKETGDEA